MASARTLYLGLVNDLVQQDEDTVGEVLEYIVRNSLSSYCISLSTSLFAILQESLNLFFELAGVGCNRYWRLAH